MSSFGRRIGRNVDRGGEAVRRATYEVFKTEIVAGLRSLDLQGQLGTHVVVLADSRDTLARHIVTSLGEPLGRGVALMRQPRDRIADAIEAAQPNVARELRASGWARSGVALVVAAEGCTLRAVGEPSASPGAPS